MNYDTYDITKISVGTFMQNKGQLNLLNYQSKKEENKNEHQPNT